MAIGWLTAFKVIPWGHVIEAAPTVVRTARGLWQRTREANDTFTDGHVADDAAPGTPDSERLSARLYRAEQDIADLEQRLGASAELMTALAEQNITLVDAVAVLKARLRLLVGCNVVLALLLGGAAWRLLG